MILKLITLSLVCLLLSLSFAQNSLESTLQDLLPFNSTDMMILGIETDPEIDRITTKFQMNIASQQDWLLDYVEQHGAAGQNLPYHQNFGITEAEYEKILNMTDYLNLVELSKASLVIERNYKEYKLSFSDGANLPFSNLSINLETGEATTQEGNLSTYEFVAADQEQSVIGQWEGLRWTLEEGNPLSGNAQLIVFSLGQITDSDKLFLEYSVKVANGGMLVVDELTMMRQPSAP